MTDKLTDAIRERFGDTSAEALRIEREGKVTSDRVIRERQTTLTGGKKS